MVSVVRSENNDEQFATKRTIPKLELYTWLIALSELCLGINCFAGYFYSGYKVLLIFAIPCVLAIPFSIRDPRKTMRDIGRVFGQLVVTTFVTIFIAERLSISSLYFYLLVEAILGAVVIAVILNKSGYRLSEQKTVADWLATIITDMIVQKTREKRNKKH